MNSDDKRRFGRVTEMIFRKLGDGYRASQDTTDRTPFHIVKRDTKRELGGDLMHNFGGPTWTQLASIMGTSPDDSEAAQRVIDLVIHKKDTTGYDYANRKQTEDMKAQILEALEEKFAQLGLSDAFKKVNEATQVDIADTTVNVMPVESPVVQTTIAPPQGVQGKKKKSVKEAKSQNQQDIELWTERVKLLGIDGPKLNKDQTKLDGRWLRSANRSWDQYVETDSSI